MSLANSFINYIKDSKKELHKVSWPSRRQTIKYGIVVIAMSVVLSAFLGAVDYIFFYIINNFIIK